MRVRRVLCALSLVPPFFVGMAAHAAGSTLASPSTVNPLWAERYNGPGNSTDVGNALAVNPAGTSVFVAGYSFTTQTCQDVVTLAYRAGTGRSLWTARYSSLGCHTDEAFAIAVSPDGGTVFVTGQTTKPSGLSAMLTIAYNATTGRPIWTAQYDPFGLGSNSDAIALSPDGARIYVTGWTIGPPPDQQDYATVAYDAATGVQLWAADYDSGSGADDVANAVAVSPDGSRVAVTGEVCKFCQDDYGTIVYDAATGSQLWVATYNGPGNSADFASAVRISAAGKVYVTGTSFGFGTAQDYATIAYDLATGTQLWVTRYDDAASGYDVATAMDLSPDGGRVYVTGSAATVAYDAGTGTQLWVAVSLPVFESNAISATSDGTRVYVTGTGGVPNQNNYITVGYLTSTGAQVWSATYQGPAGGDDESFALGLTPTAKLVFVTGESGGVGLFYDIETIAYRP